MDAIDQIRVRIIKVLGTAEDACEQAVEAQLPDISPATRLREIRSLGALLDEAKSHSDKAEAAMLKYIRLPSE